MRNLERHVPRHAHDDLRADYQRIVHAELMALARQAYQAFDDLGEAGAESHSELREASDELLTFYQFPPSQWKALRTTNAIERLHGQFH